MNHQLIQQNNKAYFLNPSAQNLWDQSLTSDDRVLITGASGWFGQTAANLMAGQPSLLLASQTRSIPSLGKNLFVNAYDPKLVRDFSPTVVIDCAFITRERIKDFGLPNYISQNQLIQKQFVELVSSPSVRRYVSFSSGAAVYPADAILRTIEENPYGYLKREAELQMESVSSELGKPGVIARAWSVSGAFITKPKSFAFTDFISQALQGKVHIKATNPVFRRYSAIEDLLAVSLAETTQGSFSILNSEGPLVEMAELARQIVSVINPAATISRARPLPGIEDNYFTDTHQWSKLETLHQFKPLDLKSQILSTFKGMKMGEYL